MGQAERREAGGQDAGELRLDAGEREGHPHPSFEELFVDAIARADGVKLVLTTATEGMPADQRALCPYGGALFVADTRFAAVGTGKGKFSLADPSLLRQQCYVNGAWLDAPARATLPVRRTWMRRA